MGKVTFDLSPELERALEQIAQRTGRSQDAVAQEAIQSYVKSKLEANGQEESTRRHERPALRSRGIISDPDVNSTNIKDWLRANWQPE